MPMTCWERFERPKGKKAKLEQDYLIGIVFGLTEQC